MGRKDRHSKVCTAKGPRDRRVRLAAHTAIQFYDVQDRLGYDRPSKAVDWLIKKAKSAIDDLAHEEEARRGPQLGFRQSNLGISANSGNGAIGMIGDDDDHRKENADNPNPQNSSFLPPSLDSDVIADTIKSFFPVAAAGAASAANLSTAVEFQNFQNSNSQDLRLSLQSVHDPIMLHRHNPPPHQNPDPQTEPPQILLNGTPLGFNTTSGWPDWNSGGDSGGSSTTSGYLINSPPLKFSGHNQLVSQRGPLQSSNSPSIHAWMDPSTLTDHQHHNHQSGIMPVYPSSISAVGFSAGGFPGFQIPARIQGDEEEHDGYSDKPSSASSDSCHRLD